MGLIGTPAIAQPLEKVNAYGDYMGTIAVCEDVV
jgi:hypothetical protein